MVKTHTHAQRHIREYCCVVVEKKKRTVINRRLKTNEYLTWNATCPTRFDLVRSFRIPSKKKLKKNKKFHSLYYSRTRNLQL